ncbi:MAG: phosphate signaling complex protein PhoU [Rhodomicrobium sp.]|jgi:phosphate transport system protein
MIGHTVTSYDDDLKSLDTKILRMGGLAEHQLKTALSAIVHADPELAHQAVTADPQIDAMQSEIEDCAVQIIARRQPVAVDLRSVVGVMRIAGDLERIGDMAKSIGKRIAAFDETAWLSPMTKNLGAMGDVALSQLKNVLDSYSRRDADLALKVWLRDEDLDRQYNSLFREMLTYMMEDPKTISFGAHLLFCAKNIERVGDHCTNVAEAVTYIVTGHTFVDPRPKHDILAEEPKD